MLHGIHNYIYVSDGISHDTFSLNEKGLAVYVKIVFLFFEYVSEQSVNHIELTGEFLCQ